MDDDARQVLLAEGREAEIFLQPDGSVLKLMRHPEWNHRIERESAALAALRSDGRPAPQVFGTTMVDGRAGLLMERVPGVDLLTVLGRRPLLLDRIARVMASQHAAMHECRAPDSLPNLRAELRGRIESAAHLPSHLAVRALAVLNVLPDGDRLCHGDLHPGNILGSWDAPVVIDWGDSTAGDPMADVARTALLMRIGQPPPGSSRFIRTVAPVGGRLVAARYLAAYRRLRPVDPVVLRRWEIVRAAARFAEGIDAEYGALRRFLERASD